MRYFYNDPLAAAWMAKHFGMRFVDRVGYSVSADPGMWYMADRHYRAETLFIAKADEDLLEPQVGDVVWGIYESGKYIGELQSLIGLPETIEIVQRNGTAFHWPESEKSKETLPCDI